MSSSRLEACQIGPFCTPHLVDTESPETDQIGGFVCGVRRTSRPHSVIGASGPDSQALNGTVDELAPTIRVGEYFTGLRPVTSVSRHIPIGTGR